jgi:hypothetical protein
MGTNALSPNKFITGDSPLTTVKLAHVRLGPGGECGVRREWKLEIRGAEALSTR